MSQITGGEVIADREPAILVVDDEKCVREIIVRWLSAEGYRCAQAGDAHAARNCLCGHEVDLVTLDMNMPGRSGTELLVEIKQTLPDTQVLMLTGNDTAEAAIDTLTKGACGYLIKPVERGQLLLQARSALERRHLILEKRNYMRQLEGKVREQTRAIRLAHEETIHRLVDASAYRDEETGAHIKRTGLYSEVIARFLGWPAPEVESVRLAAPMHDVGKIAIPDSILLKRGKLTPQEFETMKTHTVIGGEILAGSDAPMLQMAHQIAMCHHERWDGTGYPRGLAGTEIPESARIVALVDVYDALTHDRVYRPALPEKQALSIMKNGRGTHFDPRLWDAFVSLLPEIARLAEEHPDQPAEQGTKDHAELLAVGHAPCA